MQIFKNVLKMHPKSIDTKSEQFKREKNQQRKI